MEIAALEFSGPGPSYYGGGGGLVNDTDDAGCSIWAQNDQITGSNCKYQFTLR